MNSNLEITVGDLERFKTRYSLGRDQGLDSKHFLRIKVTEGALTSDQLRGIVQLSDDYGKGYAEITDRQSIQLHWIEGKDAPEIFSHLEGIGFTTDKCGQAFPGTRYGDPRNICVCPVAGFDKNELIDVRPLAKQMNDFFIGNEDFLDMPRKFKISITGCRLGCTRSEMQCLGLFSLEHDGTVGFGALVGGALGSSLPGPRLAKPLEVFIKPEEVFDVAKAMAEIHRDHGNRESKPKSRFKWLVEEWGVEKVRDKLEEKLGKKLERLEYSGPEVSGEEHIGVQEQKDGKYFVSVPVLGGRLSSERFSKAAGIADKYGSGDLRTTPYQNLIILNVSKEKLDEALKDLKAAGMPVEGSPLRWTSVGCASDFCGKAVEPFPKEAVKEIIEHLEGRFGEKLNDLRMKIGIAGCPFDCGLRGISDIGLLGVKKKEDGFSEFYDVYVGGGLGADASLGELVEKAVDLEKIKSMVEKLVAACLEEGHKNFRDFSRGYSLEELKKIASS